MCSSGRGTMSMSARLITFLAYRMGLGVDCLWTGAKVTVGSLTNGRGSPQPSCHIRGGNGKPQSIGSGNITKKHTHGFGTEHLVRFHVLLTVALLRICASGKRVPLGDASRDIMTRVISGPGTGAWGGMHLLCFVTLSRICASFTLSSAFAATVLRTVVHGARCVEFCSTIRD